jgi:hypothetical protein
MPDPSSHFDASVRQNGNLRQRPRAKNPSQTRFEDKDSDRLPGMPAISEKKPAKSSAMKTADPTKNDVNKRTANDTHAAAEAGMGTPRAQNNVLPPPRTSSFRAESFKQGMIIQAQNARRERLKENERKERKKRMEEQQSLEPLSPDENSRPRRQGNGAFGECIRVKLCNKQCAKTHSHMSWEETQHSILDVFKLIYIDVACLIHANIHITHTRTHIYLNSCARAYTNSHK